jgi:hypothetical protein
MKAVNFALVAMAGLGLVSSQVALADTAPAAAIPAPAAASRLHPVKLVRFTEKRRGDSSDVVGVLPIVIGIAAVGAVGVGIYEVAKKGSSGT